MGYAEHVQRKATPQSEPVPGRGQVKNAAGGYAFAVDKWKRLERFLILGSEGGTYYVDERELTRENAKVVEELIAEDGLRVVQTVVEVSESGRAPKNDPALLALALAAKTATNPGVRNAAFTALPKVARIGTHLLHFAAFVDALGGWGRGTKRGFARWFLEKEAADLAFQAVKYQQRDSWSMLDLLRKSHPEPAADDRQRRGVFDWIANGTGERAAKERELPPIVEAFEESKRLKEKSDLKRLIDLVEKAKLPHECVMNEMKKFPEVWEALVPSMGFTALLRNLGKMTAVGALKPLGASDCMKGVLAKLGDVDLMKRQRVHPLQVLIALKQYEAGHGDKGSLSWTAIPKVVDALDAAFYSAFGAVEPSGKSTMLAVDVSGSMRKGACAGAPTITPAVGAGAMALVSSAVETDCIVTAFTNGKRPSQWSAHGIGTGLTTLSFSKKTRLDDALRTLEALKMGGTDCALPMIEALEQGLRVETFVVYTDNETWAGAVHPFQALRKYREATGIPAKLVVVAMTANGTTIADPSDAGMLDVSGFDAGVPALISAFAR